MLSNPKKCTYSFVEIDERMRENFGSSQTSIFRDREQFRQN